MNDSNRPSSGQPPIYQGVRRMTENLHGRGIQEGFSLNNNRERNFQPGRPNLAAPGRGGEPPTPRGRGDRHVSMPGRGFYNVRDRFIEHDSFTVNRVPHRPNFGLGVNMVPPPPPPPMQGLLVRGIPPPPPPPRSNPGMWMPSPGMTTISMSQQLNHSHFNHSSFNQFPQSNNSGAIYQNLIPHHQMAINPNSQSQLLASTHNNSYVIPESIQGAATQPIDKTKYKLEIDKAWTEHIAPNSMKYFYNSITKESTYVKPEALIRSAVPSKPVEQSWVEYVDTQTGKTYYSNGVSTTWEKPESFKASARVTSENNDEDHPRKKKKAPNVKVIEFTSKSEAIVGFKGLLLAKDVQPTTKWNDVVKICSSDPRWEACEILTQGERKQALAEYQTKRANDLRDQERGERMRAKEGFTKLLTDILPSIESFNPQTSRFLVMRDYLSKDDRFFAVEDEETRESLFLEFCEEVRKRDERKKRNKKREAKASLLSFLRDHEESGELTYASTWASFNASLSNNSLSDPRFLVSEYMSESDRELYFSDFVIELQTAEDERRRRIRDARHRAEKAQRESFIELLEKMAKDGKIAPSTNWRNIEDSLSSHPTYGLVKSQDRDGPKELFQDFLEEWNATYRRDRIFLSRLLQSITRTNSVLIAKNYDEFRKSLLDAASHSPEQYGDIRMILNSENPISSARVYFNEIFHRDTEHAKAATLSMNRRGQSREDSSEDEGEIIEDEEVDDDAEIRNDTL